MAETVISGQRPEFTVLYKSVIRDERLSLRTLGFFAKVAALPPTWSYSVRGLAHALRIGDSTVRRCLEELESAGYLIREQTHDEAGKFGGTVYCWQFERPEFTQNDTPCVTFERTVNTVGQNTDDGDHRVRQTPSSVNRRQYNNNLNKRLIDTPPISPPDAAQKSAQKSTQKPAQSEDLFSRFWTAYPKKRNKVDAQKAWRALKPSLTLCRQMARALEAQKRSEQWTREGGRYIPYPATWIRGRQWENELDMPAPTAEAAEEVVYGWQSS